LYLVVFQGQREQPLNTQVERTGEDAGEAAYIVALAIHHNKDWHLKGELSYPLNQGQSLVKLLFLVQSDNEGIEHTRLKQLDNLFLVRCLHNPSVIVKRGTQRHEERRITVSYQKPWTTHSRDKRHHC
jgi:hypothetical protein